MSELSALLAALKDPKRKTPLRKLVSDLVHDDDDVLRPIARDAVATLVERLGDAGSARDALDPLFDLATAYDPYTLLAHGVDELVLDHPRDGFTLRELRRPVVERGAAVATLLGAKDGKTRLAAARLLAAVTDIEATKELRAAAAAESDALVRYHLQFALVARGVKVEVASTKDPALSVIARFVAVLAGGAHDPTLLDDALKKAKEGETFPGGDDPNLAVAAGLAGLAYRRRDAALLARIVKDAKIAGIHARVATFALTALWPTARTPVEPRAELTEAERAFLRPAFEALVEASQMPDQNALTRFGWVRDPRCLYVRRLLGLAEGPADERVDGVPLWLLARRVVDGRAPTPAWLDAMQGRAPRQVIDTVRDLVAFAVPDPWPAERLPYVSSPFFAANLRYFALVRATFANVPTPELDALVDEERANVHHATALACLVDRGVALPETRDARIKKLLRPMDEYDVEGLRAVIASLPAARRARVLEDFPEDYESDAIDKKGRLSGLWYYADLLSDERLAAAIADLGPTLSSDDLLTGSTDHSRAIAEGFAAGVAATFSRVGARAIAPLQKALADKKAKKARMFLEAALAAAGGATPVGTAKAPAAKAKEKTPVAKGKAAPAKKR